MLVDVSSVCERCGSSYCSDRTEPTAAYTVNWLETWPRYIKIIIIKIQLWLFVNERIAYLFFFGLQFNIQLVKTVSSFFNYHSMSYWV